MVIMYRKETQTEGIKDGSTIFNIYCYTQFQGPVTSGTSFCQLQETKKYSSIIKFCESRENHKTSP
jgi:hypothetical protein